MRNHDPSSACAPRRGAAPPARGRRRGTGRGAPGEPASAIYRAFTWTFVGRMVYGGCQWGILSVLAKAGGALVVGRFALALAVTAPICVLASLQLRSIHATDVLGEFSWSTYLRVRLALSAASLGLVLLVVATSASLREDAVVIAIVAVAKNVEMVEDLIYGVFQRHRAMHCFASSLLLRGVATLLAVGATALAGLPLEASVAAMLGMWSAVLVLHDWPRAKRLRATSLVASVGSGSAWRLVWLALPMGLMLLLDSLNQNVPRYLLEWTGGTSQLGIYVAMAYVIQLGGTVVFALGAPLASAMARDHAERRSAAFMRRTTILLAMTVGLGAGGVLLACLAGGSFLRLVYAEQFAAAADVFVWVMVGAAFHYVVLMCNNVLTAARLLGLQPLLWGVALLSTTAMGWLRIPPHGALGAAQAFAFGVAMAAALAIGSIVVVVRDLHRRERAG